MNILETIQKNLGFEALQKIDPNTQETKGEKTAMGNSAIAQAGIPAILIGIYNKLEENPDLGVFETSKRKLTGGNFRKVHRNSGQAGRQLFQVFRQAQRAATGTYCF